MVTRRWVTIKVELLHGRGEDFYPPPGRVLLVPSRTSFDELGVAIDRAFGRWDLAHLRRFTLPDGTDVVDDEMAREMIGSGFDDGVPRTRSLASSVARGVSRGDRFTYVFDFGDDWTHLCTHEGPGDPEDTQWLDAITPVWGWGALPDQYGRRWAEDDGQSEPPDDLVPQEFRDPFAMRRSRAELPVVDVRAVRVATRAGSVPDLVNALTGVRLDPALQQVGQSLLTLHRAAAPKARGELEAFLLNVHGRLGYRGFEGDDLLRAEILAALQGRDGDGRLVPVDLDELTTHLGDDYDGESGAYLNQESGDVVSVFLVRNDDGGDLDVDVDSDEWVFLEDDANDWHDLAAFVETLPEGSAARTRLAREIEGRGAFQRFRRAVDDFDLVPEWVAFRDDRRWGRARALLSDRGLRA